ncbi:hypothetical protein EI94DRAFT_1815141 [Lactarius quietus]|nr:hypothetical protein EI94DRAFT_1815141 [Lactarius quietus]
MSASRWLVNEVATGTNQFDNRLWENLPHAFQRQFGDVLSKERAQAQLDAGIHMKDGKINDYIAQFEQLKQHKCVHEHWKSCHDYPEAHTWESRAKEDVEEEKAVRALVAAEDDSYLAYDEACKILAEGLPQDG